MSDNEVKPIRHRIGSARTIRTAVMVCEYLRARACQPHSSIHESAVSFYFNEPDKANGFWSADIIVTIHGDKYDKQQDQDLSRMVELCRAFVAGAGEVWA